MLGNKYYGNSKKIFCYFLPIYLFLLSNLAFSAPTNIIFLDIDGVLNNAKSGIEELYIVEPDLLKNLNQIVKATDAKIVLQSTWRYGGDEALTKLAKYFKDSKVPYWIDITDKDNTTNSKAKEISTYIDTNYKNNKDFNFVVIDDMNAKDQMAGFSPNSEIENVTAFLDGHYVHVDKVAGLTETDAAKAIEILFGKKPIDKVYNQYPLKALSAARTFTENLNKKKKGWF